MSKKYEVGVNVCIEEDTTVLVDVIADNPTEARKKAIELLKGSGNIKPGDYDDFMYNLKPSFKAISVSDGDDNYYNEKDEIV